MPCLTGCRCGCGHTGCGCHEKPKTIRGTRRTPACTVCGSILVLRDTVSQAGRTVTLARCPRCDLDHR